MKDMFVESRHVKCGTELFKCDCGFWTWSKSLFTNHIKHGCKKPVLLGDKE